MLKNHLFYAYITYIIYNVVTVNITVNDYMNYNIDKSNHANQNYTHMHTRIYDSIDNKCKGLSNLEDAKLISHVQVYVHKKV